MEGSGSNIINHDPVQSAQMAPWALLLKLSIVSSDELEDRRKQQNKP
ncbi:hypothetical protein [Paenibacillus caseinilyticus]|nr:hypothetical protein [Paenibacillus caseinilyticus]MCZ8523636.1 hypothetical protein [Paenibacillus caseinilyticus]